MSTQPGTPERAKLIAEREAALRAGRMLTESETEDRSSPFLEQQLVVRDWYYRLGSADVVEISLFVRDGFDGDAEPIRSTRPLAELLQEWTSSLTVPYPSV